MSHYDVPRVSFTFQEQQDFGDTHVGGDMISAGYTNSPTEDWIKAHRSLRFHPIVGFLNEDGTPRKGIKVCETTAWLDLCMEAGWKARKYNNKGRVILVDRGQLIGARKWLASRWGWTEEAVRWFFKKLQRENMIEIGEGTPIEANANQRANTASHTQRDTQPNNQRRSNQSSVITICNYDIYQTVRELQNLINNQQNTAPAPSEHQASTQPAPSEHPDLKKERREEEREREEAREGTLFSPVEPDDADELYVNGKYIKGSRFGKLLYESLDTVAASIGVEPETARQIAIANAKQWQANKMKIRDPLALITSALKAHKRPAPKPKKQVERNYTDNFEAWWKLYPRKEGKGEAFDVWESIKKIENHRKAYRELQKQLPELTERAKDKRGNFCMQPARWLRQGCFDDEIKTLASENAINPKLRREEGQTEQEWQNETRWMIQKGMVTEVEAVEHGYAP